MRARYLLVVSESEGIIVEGILPRVGDRVLVRKTYGAREAGEGIVESVMYEIAVEDVPDAYGVRGTQRGVPEVRLKPVPQPPVWRTEPPTVAEVRARQVEDGKKLGVPPGMTKPLFWCRHTRFDLGQSTEPYAVELSVHDAAIYWRVHDECGGHWSKFDPQEWPDREWLGS